MGDVKAGRGGLQGRVEEEAMKQFNLELTNHCNFSCSFCANSLMTRERGFMKKELAFKILSEIAQDNLVEYVCLFLMGEPFLHPDLLEICEFAKNKGLKIKLNTNNSIVAEGGWKRLFEINTDVIQLSISPDRTQFKQTRGSGLNFKDYIFNYQTILALRRENQVSTTKLIIAMISTPGNVEANFNLYGNFFRNPLDRFLTKHGLRMQRFCEPNNVEIIFGVLHNWGNIFEKKVIPAWFGSCDAGRDQLAVLWNGDYTLCCRDYDGKLRCGWNANDWTIKEFLELSELTKLTIKNFKRGKLSFPFCRICRGGRTIPEWLFNQCFSLIYYNLPFYDKLRRFCYAGGNRQCG